MVERQFEALCVVGSIPSPATIDSDVTDMEERLTRGQTCFESNVCLQGHEVRVLSFPPRLMGSLRLVRLRP